MTSFVGRRADLAETLRLLGTTRLLTLTGTGGVGKTRLALMLAATVASEYRGGVWLVDLAPLGDPALVPRTVAAALGLVDDPARAVTARLVEHLRARDLLLVLDNCEHLVDACAVLADALLRGSAGLRVLATSREPLNVPGEVAWRVPSLAEDDAARLFVERASAAAPGSAPTAVNAAVAQVCRRLDGIPLAIELAAARVRGLAVEQVLARLDDRFRLLTGGSRTALRRQQTLRAAVDWSHDLLSAPETVLLRRLAVFSGGWTLEGAEQVCADGAVGAEDVLDLLLRLVDRSLVVADRQPGAARYRLLETIRQYALEKLRAAGEEVAVRRRHRDWYAAWAERSWPELLRPDQARWSARFAADHDNLRAALEWSRREAGDGSDGRAPAVGALAVQAADAELRLAAALGRFWLWRGHWHESRVWLEDALARASTGPSAARALALNWAGWLQTLTGAVGDGRAHLEASAAMAGQVGAWTTRSLALRHLAMIADALGDDDREEVLLQDALASARRSTDGRETAWCLLQMGALSLVRGDPAAAERLSGESLLAGRQAGDKGTVSHALLHLGQVAASRGRYAEAAGLLQDALSAAVETGLQNGIAAAHRRLGDLARARGDHPAARASYAASLAVARDAGVGIEAAWTLQRCAGLSAADGAFERAARLFGAADAWREGAASLSLPGIFGRADRAAVALDLATSRAALGEAGFAAAFADGQATTLAQAIADAVAGPAVAPERGATGRSEADGPLSPREREVARLIQAGSTNRQIAEALVIAEPTAERHVANVFNKLGVHSRAQVAAWAAQHLASGTPG